MELKKKTAMNKMIDYLCSIGEYDIVDKAIELLKKEEEQILDAYYQGGNDACPNGKAGDIAAKQYYTNTFSTRY